MPGCPPWGCSRSSCRAARRDAEEGAIDLGLTGRTCLVTGASSGIGRATAVALAREGVQVLASARSIEPLSSLRDEIIVAGGLDPILLAADLADPEGPGRLAREALDRVARIDVLVNNAGGSRPMSDPDDETVWAEATDFNFHAARRLTGPLVEPMAAAGWGRVVNVSGAIVAKAINAAGPAKAALESWSKGLAAAYAARGVTVNCVAPGRIDSRQIRETLHPTPESRDDFIARNIPAGRFGEAEEAAALIVFLASAPASYVNGTTIPVDGGALRYAF